MPASLLVVFVVGNYVTLQSWKLHIISKLTILGPSFEFGFLT